MRIALVEDDPQQAHLMESWLGEAGFTSRLYANADGFLLIATATYGSERASEVQQTTRTLR